MDDEQDVIFKNLPSWVERCSNDEWNFGISLKNGLKIGFGSCVPSEAPDGQVWLHLRAAQGEAENERDGCIELNDRGMWVRFNEVCAFWERCTT